MNQSLPCLMAKNFEKDLFRFDKFKKKNIWKGKKNKENVIKYENFLNYENLWMMIDIDIYLF